MDDAAIERIARVCHEATRAWYAVNGNTSQTPWMFTPDWQRHRVITNVRLVLANPATGASAQHDAWMVGKLRDGS